MSNKDQPKKHGATIDPPHQRTDTIRCQVEILTEDTNPARIYVTSLDKIIPPRKYAHQNQ